MGSIVVQAFITLDGVVQAGGGPEEDPENHFPHAGWAARYDAAHGGDDINNLVESWEERTDALLLGRKTYDIFAGSWGVRDESAEGLDGVLTRRYNRVPKFVASRTLIRPGWRNTHLLGSDVPAEVRKLREWSGGEIRVWGSTVLVRALAQHDLIDEYRLVTYPLVLGSGKKLFTEGFPAGEFSPAETVSLPSGIVVGRYRRRS